MLVLDSNFHGAERELPIVAERDAGFCFLPSAESSLDRGHPPLDSLARRSRASSPGSILLLGCHRYVSSGRVCCIRALRSCTQCCRGVPGYAAAPPRRTGLRASPSPLCLFPSAHDLSPALYVCSPLLESRWPISRCSLRSDNTLARKVICTFWVAWLHSLNLGVKPPRSHSNADLN